MKLLKIYEQGKEIIKTGKGSEEKDSKTTKVK